jgi:hypothetical protein
MFDDLKTPKPIVIKTQAKTKNKNVIAKSELHGKIHIRTTFLLSDIVLVQIQTCDP